MPTAPTKSGYTFGGWYEDEAFAGEYEFTTMPAEDVTVYAKWNVITYAIEYVLNGGEVATENPVAYTVETQAFTLVNPIKTGYTFTGWTGTDLVDKTVTVVIEAMTGNRTYTANFEINEYSISFDTNGGSIVDSIVQDYNTAVVVPTAPTKSGYTFGGWYEDEAFAGEYEFTTMPAEDVTVYAKWNVITYAIEYDLDGGAEISNPASYTIESQTITLANPTKDGYTFIGWTGTGLEVETLSVLIESGSIGDRNYVANFERNVPFISNDENKVTVSTEDTYGLPTDIELVVEVVTNVSSGKGSVGNVNVQSMLKRHEKVTKVYDVRLIRTVNGVETEIQPSDIKEGMTVTVKIRLPEDVSTKNLKVLHVHNSTDIEYIENYTIEDGYIVFEIDRLSEFVFINVGTPLWKIILIVAEVVIVLFIIIFLLVGRKKGKKEQKEEEEE